MKLRLVTLLFMFSLFAISANRAWACGKERTQSETKSASTGIQKSCCSESKDIAPCSDDAKHQHSEAECPCDHDNGGCHCPGCGLICHAGAGSVSETSLPSEASLHNDSVQKMAFYFADHLPEAVYLAIWLPPKVDV